MSSNAEKKQLSEKQDFEITQEMKDKVQARMDAMGNPDEADVEGVPRLEKKDKEEEVKDENEEVKEEQEEEEEEVKDENEEVKEEQEEEEVKDDSKKEHVLPENYFQAMRHVGWEPERIKRVFEADPEQALEDFKFYHDSQNYVTQQTSSLGRAQQKQTQRATDEATTKVKKDEAEYKGIDLKAIEDELGEDSPAAVAIIKAVNESNKLLYKEVQDLKQQRVEQAGPSDEEKVIWNTITTHFNSADIKVFDEFYGSVEAGKNWEQSLTGAQLQSRMNVIQEADAYHAGMKLQGKDVEYSEALNRAHLVISAPIQEKILRNELHDKIKKRSKGITVKSTGKATAKDTSKKKDPDATLLSRTKDRLKKLTGREPAS